MWFAKETPISTCFFCFGGKTANDIYLLFEKSLIIFLNSEIFKNDKDVFTFSMHCASNYPAKKSKSDMDIELKEDMEDREYLDILNFNLKSLNQLNFDFVFYIAGVDVHYQDKLGKLKLTEDGINQRDKTVINNFFSKKIPLCGVLGGGYNKDFDKLVELHSMLHRNCANLI